MNAYETETGDVVLDVCRYDRMFDGNYNGPFSNNTELTLDRWTINPGTRAVQVDRIDDRAQEFPRCHPDRNGKTYRYGYSVTVEGGAFPRILKHDLQTGQAVTHDLGAGRSSGEALFVPKAGAKREDEGYLMAWVYDPAADVSEFVVLDAEAMEQIASVKLPVRVPYGFHGSWIADA
jgi:carotenoid cleavage dioxygenase